ncbi:MAG TPA: glycosyltransferase family 39 protein [Candidatus Acidoferrum sp.]|nr:glycosyltransferase family 39 protein [Candidatus Acidoferrum sp.]
MIDESTSKSHLEQLKAAFNKWRLALLVLALSYFVLLFLNLSNFPMNWDEMVHLNGALFLKHGLYTNFVNNSFYPPLFDSVTFGFFNVFGVSLFSARLVSTVFSVLTLWAVFELAYSMYGGKVALLSAVLLAVMPGYFWLSRMALLEIMLVFFFTLSMFFFYRWLGNHQNKMLVFSGLALGLGFLTKYQVLVAVVVMTVSLVFLGRGQLKRLFSRFTILIGAALLIAVPWLVIAYKVYANQILSQWAYAIQMGNPDKSLYSIRFPVPIFYFVEMVWPYADIHPISLLLYVVGLAGLGLFVLRRKKEDKFLLTWFVSVLVFFTLISNREWRYVLTLFPTLAISAAAFILFVYNKAQTNWKGHIGLNKKRATKIAAGLFILFLGVALAISINDNYTIVSKYNIQIHIQDATNYAITHDPTNQSIMVLCPFNFFSQDMVNFYLLANDQTQIHTYQYPQLPVDTYTPTFNITEFINLCKQNNVKFVFTYENGGTATYFNTTLNLQQIYEKIYASGNFSGISDQATFGTNPRRIMVLNFTG